MTKAEETVEAIGNLLDACKDALDGTQDAEIRTELMKIANAGIKAKAVAMASVEQEKRRRVVS